MRTTAHYHLVLHAGSDPEAFETLFADDGMRDVLQTTRITSAFDTRLLRATRETPGDDTGSVSFGRYVWQVDVTLMTDAGYRFGENVERLQERVAGVATVYGVDAFTTVAAAD